MNGGINTVYFWDDNTLRSGQQPAEDCYSHVYKKWLFAFVTTCPDYLLQAPQWLTHVGFCLHIVWCIAKGVSYKEIPETFEFSFQKYTINRKFSSWDKIFVDQCYSTSRIPRFCCLNQHRSASMFHIWNKAFRIIGLLGRSPSTNRAWCWEQHEGRSCDHITHLLSSDLPSFVIVTPYFWHFSDVFSNQRFSNRSSAVDVGYVKLSSDCICG